MVNDKQQERVCQVLQDQGYDVYQIGQAEANFVGTNECYDQEYNLFNQWSHYEVSNV